MKSQRRRLVEYPSFPLKIKIQVCLLVRIYVEERSLKTFALLHRDTWFTCYT